MESYYRAVRKRSGLLMDADGEPAGGRWNFDAENRKPWKGDPPPPKPWDSSADLSSLWREIQAAGVRTFGEPMAERFPWPLDRAEALAHLRELAAERDEEGLPTAVASTLQETALERFFAEVDLAELMLATGSTR